MLDFKNFISSKKDLINEACHVNIEVAYNMSVKLKPDFFLCVLWDSMKSIFERDLLESVWCPLLLVSCFAATLPSQDLEEPLVPKITHFICHLLWLQSADYKEQGF